MNAPALGLLIIASSLLLEHGFRHLERKNAKTEYLRRAVSRPKDVDIFYTGPSVIETMSKRISGLLSRK